MDIEVLSGKEALKFWIHEAVRRDANDESFTDDEVTTIFGSIEKVFGAEEASGAFNEVIKTLHNTHELNDRNRLTFNRSVVRYLANGVSGENE